jgi:hypothetical protein
MQKVATLSNSTLRQTAHIRDRLSNWSGDTSCVGAHGVGNEDYHHQSSDVLNEFELLCRTSQGSWITARQAAPRRTLIATEAPMSLPEAALFVHKLYDGVARGFYAGLG